MPNMNLVNNANPQPLWISSHNSLKPHQSKENYTKKTQFSYSADAVYFRAKIFENWCYFSWLVQ